MIDEKKLIEAFEENNLYLPEAVEKMINSQPKIGEWIPCSERLPEESLSSVIGWDKYRERCCFVQYLGGRWIFGNDVDSVNIIAWMPLPEPYKENEEKEMAAGGMCDIAQSRE